MIRQHSLPRGRPTARLAVAMTRAFVLATLIVAASASAPRAAHADTAEAALLALVNRYRAAHDLAPLTPEPRLIRAARHHAQAMAREGFFAHTTPEGDDLGARLRAAGYGFFLAAENLAHGQRNPAEAFAAWRDSPGHDRNMRLAAARQAGVGLVAMPGQPDRRIWVLVIAAPLR